MNVDFEKLQVYLSEHPQKYPEESMKGLVDVLFWHYMENNFVSSEVLQSKTREARTAMGMLSEKETDNVFSCFYHICVEYQRLAFTAGVQTGAQMALDLLER